MHIHAFYTLEIDHGRKTLNISAQEVRQEIKSAGINTLTGTAAEM